jgi:A/G-specific adenine glycosylase
MSGADGDPVSGAATARRVTRLRRVLTIWGPAEGRVFPWRESGDPYLRLLAEVLLQRTRAETVASVWPVIVRKFPTPERLAAASEDRIASTIRPLGLERKRAGYLKRLGEALRQSGVVPRKLADLTALPGVGPYSAGAFLASWHGDRTAPVDTNVQRVLGRVALGLDAAGRRSATALVERLLSRGDTATVLYALLDFGSAPCRPRRPLCESCPARSFCAFGRLQRAAT